jgi:hypothetical protein
MADLYPDACGKSETDEAAPLSVEMTVFSAPTPLVKSYALAEDGNLAEPIPGANLAAATARHETLAGATASAILGRLPRLFSGLTSRQAIAPGSFPECPATRRSRSPSRRSDTARQRRAHLDAHGLQCRAGAAALDFDAKWDTPPLLEKLQAEHDGDRWAAVRAAVPGLAIAASSAARAAAPASSEPPMAPC